MKHTWWPGTILACVVLIASYSVAQTDVILGQSTVGDVLFTNLGPDSASVMFTGTCGANANCLSGFGYFGTNVGTYDMWITGGTPTLGVPNGGTYPINMNGATISFTFGYGSSFLDGNVNLQNVTDNSNAPRFLAGLQITASNIPGFNQGNYSDMDFNVYLGTNPPIDQVYAGTYSTTRGVLSSGELVPSPEPASLALFASGLVALSAALRRKFL